MAAYRELGVPRGVADVASQHGNHRMGAQAAGSWTCPVRSGARPATRGRRCGHRALRAWERCRPRCRTWASRDAARGRLLECLTILETMDAPREGMYALDALSEWLLATGRPSESARMAGAAETARVVLGVPTHASRARSRPGPGAGAHDGTPRLRRGGQARAEGRTLTLRQALEEGADDARFAPVEPALSRVRADRPGSIVPR